MRFLIPDGGVSALDAPGHEFWWPEADAELFDTIVRHTHVNEARRIVRVPAHINDMAFVDEVVRNVRSVL
ncbi:MAG: Tm-1-like ATP-binding domain-containing protein [Variovorax sp.]